jgi:hypothetical protein
MNLNQSILVSPAGRPMFGLGGESAFRTHEYKGYTVSLEWDETDGEPIMLIWSSFTGRELGAFGICLSSAGKYAEPTGKPTRECFLECWKSLPTLGRNQIDMECHTLVDVVIRYIPDLLMMPPAPRALKAAAKGETKLMDVTVKDHRDRVVGEKEL